MTLQPTQALIFIIAPDQANRTKRVGLYARVSTGAQLENTSSESQLQRCKEYCRVHRHTVVTEREEAIPGTFVLARSKFNQLLQMGADGLLDVIVCDIPDRLARGDAIAKLELLAQMNGLRIEYATPGRDTSTVEGLIGKQQRNVNKHTGNCILTLG